MTDHTLSFQSLLQQHRAAYLQTLPGRLAQLDALAGQVADAGQRAAALPVLERCAHSLAGSAGTFGFAVLGEAARVLELLVEEAGEGADRAAQVLAALGTLRRHLQGAMAAAEPTEVAR